MKTGVKKWQVKIRVAEVVYNDGSWIELEGSPFIYDFDGTSEVLWDHMPRLGIPYCGGLVMNYEVFEK